MYKPASTYAAQRLLLQKHASSAWPTPAANDEDRCTAANNHAAAAAAAAARPVDPYRITTEHMHYADEQLLPPPPQLTHRSRNWTPRGSTHNVAAGGGATTAPTQPTAVVTSEGSRYLRGHDLLPPPLNYNSARRRLLPPCVAMLPEPHTDLAPYLIPTDFATPQYIDNMGIVLKHMADRTPPHRGLQLRFDSVTVPQVPIDEYLDRIRRFFGCSPECFVLAMIYIDRLIRLHEGHVFLCSLNVHRVLVTAVLLAAKFFDDMYYANAYYAKIGGLTTQEINVLESHFLNLIKYDLYVTPREFENYRREVSRVPTGRVSTQTPRGQQRSVGSEVGFCANNVSSREYSSTRKAEEQCSFKQFQNDSQIPVSISSTQCSTPTEVRGSSEGSPPSLIP